MEALGSFLEVLISGLLAGVLYSLVALGFVLIFKASGVFNFAQGAMVLVAGLALVRSLDWMVASGLSAWVAIPLALVFAGLAAGSCRMAWPMVVAGLAWWFVAPSIGVVVAVVAVAAWPSEWPRVPRIRGLFAWGYGGHLLALGAVVAAGVGK